LCGSGLYCDTSAQCAQRQALGATCRTSTDCLTTLTCAAGTCSQRAQQGAPCSPSNEGNPCAEGFTCEATTSTCVQPSAQPGEACGSNGKVCLVGPCSKAGTCPAIVADGQPCPVGDDTRTCDVLADCDRYGNCAIPGSTFLCQ
jgi:hypothetical protein